MYCSQHLDAWRTICFHQLTYVRLRGYRCGWAFTHLEDGVPSNLTSPLLELSIPLLANVDPQRICFVNLKWRVMVVFCDATMHIRHAHPRFSVKMHECHQNAVSDLNLSRDILLGLWHRRLTFIVKAARR